MSNNIVFLEGCEPDGLTALKINALSSRVESRSSIHLVYWERIGSSISMPFSIEISDSRIHRLSCQDFTGVAGKLVSRARVFIQLFSVLRRLKPSIVQVATFDLLFFLLLSAPRTSKIIFDLRDTADWMMNRFMHAMIRFLLKRVDAILVTSPKYETEFLRKHELILSQTPVFFIPNTPAQSSLSLYEPKKKDDNLIVGYIGTFRGRQSISVFAEGIAKARNRGVRVCGYFAGVGVELPLVEALCVKYDFLKYGGAYVYTKDIAHLYSKIDIVYAVYDSSNNKSIALACRLAEAIVCGMPTIVLDGTYMSEVVRERGVGFVMGKLDSDEFADLIVSVAYDDGKVLERIRHQCNASKSDFLFDSYKQSFLKVYSTLEVLV